MTRKNSRRTFTKFALKHHKRNYSSTTQRGGIRL